MASKSTTPKRSTSRSKSAAKRTPRKRTAPTAKPPRRTTAKTVKRKATKAKAARVAVASHTAVARRMIFWDVENTSGEADLLRVLEHLKVDRLAQPTEFVAVGNWRSIGAKIARLLAAAGARLVHSAPAVGVRDWSDLWIAVAAGQWLGHARPGDLLEVVSDDRAFDAVADTAAALGVVFKRISYRTLTGTIERERERPAATTGTTPLSRGQRRRAARRRATGSRVSHTLTEPARAAEVVPPPFAEPLEDAAHAASQEQVHSALARLSGGSSERWISLDALANALRTAGFTRPPGSPRLVTRLRRTKDVELSPNGMVRLLNQRPPAETAPAPAVEPSEPPPPARKRPRRRRPRGGGRSGGAAETASAATEDASPEPISEPTV